MKAAVFLKWLSELVAVSYAAQIPLTFDSSSTTGIKTTENLKDGAAEFKRFITPQFSALVNLTLEVTKTPGLSLGIVQVVSHTNDVQTEFGTWGTMTEDGDEMMQEVCLIVRAFAWGD